MGNDQYMRRYRVLVKSKSSEEAINVSELRCTFEVHKAVSEEPGYSRIVIYNMAQKTIGKIKSGDTVILEAGYKNGSTGMIFSGTVVQPILRWEDAVTSALTLICQDGDVFLNNAFTIKTLAKGSTPLSQLQEATHTDTGSIDTGIVNNGLDSQGLPRGKVMFGSSADYISQIAKGNDAQCFIEDSVLNIVKAADYSANTAVELNPKTGLIGFPEQTEDGVSAQCLINPRIKLNTLVYINNTLVSAREVDEGETAYTNPSTNGVYRIVQLTYSGDTDGDDWTISFDAITQASINPVGLVKDANNPWR